MSAKLKTSLQRLLLKLRFSQQYLPLVKKLLLLVLILLIVYSLRSLFIVALVNNYPISRLSVIKELEKQGGNQVLESLINERLILQEAAKIKAVVSQNDIDKEIKTIGDNLKTQGSDLDSALALQGQTKADLVKAIKLKLLIEKIMVEKLAVTEGEIKTYYDTNKTTLYKGKTLEQAKAEVKNLLQQQKLNREYQTWIEEINKKAKIIHIFDFTH